MYSAENKCPYVFKKTEARNYLTNRINDNFSSNFGKLDENYFDTYAIIYERIKKSI